MPLKFKKILIDDQRYESAAIIDVNGDGHLDIVSGSYWYEGPDFTKRHIVAPQEPQDVEYFDDFSTVPLDVNGNAEVTNDLQADSRDVLRYALAV